VQVLRLLESFDLATVNAAVRDALRLGAIGFDAVKHCNRLAPLPHVAIGELPAGDDLAILPRP